MPIVTCEISEKSKAWYIDAYGKHTPGCEAILALWPSLAAKSLPEVTAKFTRAELNFLFDIFNGMLLDPQLPMGMVVLSTLEDAFNMETSKIEAHGINAGMLYLKVSKLGMAELYILIEWITRVWLRKSDQIFELTEKLSMPKNIEVLELLKNQFGTPTLADSDDDFIIEVDESFKHCLHIDQIPEDLRDILPQMVIESTLDEKDGVYKITQGGLLLLSEYHGERSL